MLMSLSDLSTDFFKVEFSYEHCPGIFMLVYNTKYLMSLRLSVSLKLKISVTAKPFELYSSKNRSVFSQGVGHNKNKNDNIHDEVSTNKM